ncbi:MAG: ATP synthase F1 subunit epsilon [Ilumatobacteraceae bacterium]|nr:ATP synthase F1 subunit epsilon [Ilumatobacteraceae bacterium]
MASGATMKVEVVSPERVLFSGAATQLITRTESGGEIAFLPGHTSFLGVLTENHTRIFLEDGRVQSVAVHGGFVEASGGHVTLLSDNAELAEDIDVARARAAKERAESLLRGEHEASVAADLRRADARLSATGGLVSK